MTVRNFLNVVTAEAIDTYLNMKLAIERPALSKLVPCSRDLSIHSNNKTIASNIKYSSYKYYHWCTCVM